jgi:hypothetical protein
MSIMEKKLISLIWMTRLCEPRTQYPKDCAEFGTNLLSYLYTLSSGNLHHKIEELLWFYRV